MPDSRAGELKAMANKFKAGDRVVMTETTRKHNPRAKSRKGVILGYSKKYDTIVKLRRDGLLSVEQWHEDAWDLDLGLSHQRV